MIIFKVPNKGIFLIQNGNEIIYSPINETQDESLRLYILGTCMSAILMQRKIFPLHRSSIAINDKAYAIVEDSGAGKSTLAKAFLNRGFHLLSDDVIPITFSDQHTPIVIPSYPQQKLWVESLNHFGLESSQPLIERDTKFSVPVSAQFINEQMPLAGIYELIKIESNKLSLMPIQSMVRFQTLFNHPYRNLFIEGSGLMEWHFDTSAKLVETISLFRICRPISGFTADEIVELILA